MLPHQSANEDQWKVEYAPVRLLTLEMGATRVPREREAEKQDELWLGEARDPFNPDTDIPTSIYLRLASPNPLVAELVCGIFAHHLGLPSPEVFVILIEPGHLKDSKICPPNQRALAVATRDLGGRSFSQLLRSNSQTAINMIKKWEHLLPITIFDEWVANTDRNQSNILYTAQALHIIDHAEAFGGSTRDLFPLADITKTPFANKIFDFLEKNPDAIEVTLEKIKRWLAETAGTLDINAAVLSAGILRWQTNEEQNELLDFVKQRLLVTYSLLCNRLGHPQLNEYHED